MYFIIEDRLIYDSLKGTLRLVDEIIEDAVTLTPIANKILEYLITHHGELVMRNELFDNIWEKEGFVSSSNTLNQYVSNLRKLFSQHFYNIEVIITIPRAGYTFSKDIKVIIRDDNVKDEIIKTKNKKIPLKFIFIALMISALAFFYKFMHNNEKTLPQRKIGQIGMCSLYDISGVKSESADFSNLKIANEIYNMNNLECTKTTSFYIFSEETIHLDKPAQVLFSSCLEWKNNRDTCQNFYYYTWVR